jgi:HAD superfamily hydrolase (TIGR01549 family)
MKRSLFTSLAMGASKMKQGRTPVVLPVLPVLRGVVFDMDGTLTQPNLDFGEMYRRCGVDRSQDILEEIAAMPSSQQQAANDILEEMEEEGRRTLQLMPGALELIQWLSSHDIPMALVTRNTRKSANVLTDKLLASVPTLFSTVITRDDDFPPKPDPAALHSIADRWQVELPSESILMVGDSVEMDIMFGKKAGVRTALLDTKPEKTSGTASGGVAPHFSVDHLGSLPRQLWLSYQIDSPLGTFAELHGLPPPEPTSDLTKAAAGGDLQSLNRLLETSSETAVNAVDSSSGNTALIWAAEMGQLEIVERLLSVSGIDMHLPGYLGANAVNRAARRGHGLVLERLIQAGAQLDTPNDKMQYPLHFAAFKQHEDIVRLLLKSGASPYVLDRKGRTPAEDTSCESIRDHILQAMTLHKTL